MFRSCQDTEMLTNAQTCLIRCKQGPEQSILEHSGNFNKAVRLLADLDNIHVKDDKFVLCLSEQSLNMVYTEVFRPVEITTPEISYDGARQELLRLELAGKIFSAVNPPGAHVASSAPVMQAPTQQGRGGRSQQGKGGR